MRYAFGKIGYGVFAVGPVRQVRYGTALCVVIPLRSGQEGGFR